MHSDEDDDIPTLAPKIVPVTILTGFLGSGKTTLLQYILGNPHGLRIAVVLNEFSGVTAIEKGLSVRSSAMDNDEWLEMPNGCMCCTAKDRAVEAIEALVTSRPIDHVVVEASGLSDPGPIATMFWKDEAMSSSLRLDGVVAVVDASRMQSYLATDSMYPEALRQVQVADKIILNKADLVTPEALTAAKAILCHLNAIASHEVTSFAKIVDVGALLQIHSLELWRLSTLHVHATHVGHCLLTLHGKIHSRVGLDHLARDLLWESSKQGVEVIRAKGLFPIRGEPVPYILQAVGEVYEYVPSSDAQTHSLEGVTLLVLGRGVTEAFVRPILEAAMR